MEPSKLEEIHILIFSFPNNQIILASNLEFLEIFVKIHYQPIKFRHFPSGSFHNCSHQSEDAIPFGVIVRQIDPLLLKGEIHSFHALFDYAKIKCNKVIEMNFIRGTDLMSSESDYNLNFIVSFVIRSDQNLNHRFQRH